jgi:PhnB protein
MQMPDGTIAHGDFLIGDAHVMLGEASGPWPAQTTSLYLYVPDCDGSYKQALTAAVRQCRSRRRSFTGIVHGAVNDPCGNTWWIADARRGRVGG